METKRRAFNNRVNSKNQPYKNDIIRFSQIVHIDRLQFSLRSQYGETIMSQFKSLFRYIRPIKDGRKFIHEFKYGRSLIHLARWRSGSFYTGLIIHDPSIEIQLKVLQIMRICPMSLSQVEIAFDFYPDNKNDLYDLGQILRYGLVLKYSRPGCYSEYHGTDYIGKGGNVRKGSKGVRIYKKQVDGKNFIRIELQFNRAFIKRNGISLPLDVDKINLLDFVDYRRSIDEDRLLNLLCKKWARPVERAKDVVMERGCERYLVVSLIEEYILNNFEAPVCDQIGRFKAWLKPVKLSHRVSEFFPRSETIREDICKGFVRRNIWNGQTVSSFG